MLSYEDAKNSLLNGDSSYADFFKENGYTLEYGYCQIFKGRLIVAKHELKKLENDLRADWALKLINLIEKRTDKLPSYFQIRNFLEIDLGLLLSAKRPDYIENIINSADILYNINQESYKFIARFMYNNNFEEVALYFLLKAKNKFYKDPEMHYLMANCYIKMRHADLAKKSLNACLQIIPDYLPAKKLRDKLTKI